MDEPRGEAPERGHHHPPANGAEARQAPSLPGAEVDADEEDRKGEAADDPGLAEHLQHEAVGLADVLRGRPALEVRDVVIPGTDAVHRMRLEIRPRDAPVVVAVARTGCQAARRRRPPAGGGPGM